MGVTGLWPILQPVARPIKLETLNRKRLAVDASIWIYQFLKAVRDKEGNALRNSHVVGFFRRICKLLFFGIKPVFVFDGGAPALKRQTVLGRKRRREGRRDDAVRTAGKLLAIQMQRRIEEDEERRKESRPAGAMAAVEDEEETIPADKELVYVDELGMSEQQRSQTRKFTRRDAYHLPDLQGNIGDMGQPNDPRIMSAEELEEYARQFDNGEDINLYDFSKIDFNGEFFLSLPPGDRYNILNAARLRSRLRMGLSKDQLDTMFPDRMAFSKFQIERVRERNELTQRLMNLNGMNDKNAMWGVTGTGRIAGERGREYVLVKNDGVEGGYALGVVSRDDKDLGERKKPIDIDALETGRQELLIEHESDADDDFEDVPVEGLNRLPKIAGRRTADYDLAARNASKWRQQYYGSQRNRPAGQETESMFVDQDVDDSHPGLNDLFEESQSESEKATLDKAIALSLGRTTQGEEPANNSEEEALNRAIAMSLEKQHGKPSESEDEDMDFEDVIAPSYQQKAVPEPRPLTKASGKMVAHMVNNRANAAVPKRKSAFEDSDDDDENFQAVLTASSKLTHKSAKRSRISPAPRNIKNPFDGPLPFESLNFKTSLFGKKRQETQRPTSDDGVDKMDEDNEDEDLAGGFQVDDDETSKPLPPWIVEAGDIRSDMKQQRERDAELNAEDRARAEEERELYLRDHGVINVESSDEDSDVELLEVKLRPDAADAMDLTRDSVLSTQIQSQTPHVSMEELDMDMDSVRSAEKPAAQQPKSSQRDLSDETPNEVPETNAALESDGETEQPIEWSDSDREVDDHEGVSALPGLEKATGSSTIDFADNHSPPPDFQDVEVSNTVISEQAPQTIPRDVGDTTAEGVSDLEFDEFSDPEDEELLAQLAIEAEEHARFASTLNTKSAAENLAAYEKELKALRTQQKKDRRDADEVSHIMITECQTLLRLFGIPYITAPMEAEAQCSELVRLGLVDGIVTDDSDCLLFDGTRVYKNMFNNNKFVECYLKADIEKELTLSRHQLISIAHLLGSDYTEGLAGIGPVTALEILSEFPSENGLQEFRDWWIDVQANKRAKEEDGSSTFRKKFRKSQGTKLFLPPAFPSQAVTEAYLHPDVDSTPEAFQWGVPDLDNLRAFLMATIGWDQDRTDEVLVPVIRDMNRREAEGTQSNITRYFEGSIGIGAASKEGFAPRVRGQGSTRMKAAVKKLRAKSGKSGAGPLEETIADEAIRWAKKNELSDKKHQEMLKQKRAARRKGKGKGKKKARNEDSDSSEPDDADDE